MAPKTTTKVPRQAAATGGARAPKSGASKEQQAPAVGAAAATLDVLFIVLGRQKQRARAAAQARRRGFLAEAALSAAPRGLIEASDGALDEDGEAGGIAGGGWRRDTADEQEWQDRGPFVEETGSASERNDEGPESLPEDAYFSEEDEGAGAEGMEQTGDEDDDNAEPQAGAAAAPAAPAAAAAAPPPLPFPATRELASLPSAEADFRATARAMTGVCKTWRFLVLRVVDKLSIALPDGDDAPPALAAAEDGGTPPTTPPPPTNPLSLLRAASGGALRAVRVSGSPPSNSTAAAVPLLAVVARGVGLATTPGPATATAPAPAAAPDARLAAALGGLRLLHVERAAVLLGGGQTTPPSSPPAPANPRKRPNSASAKEAAAAAAAAAPAAAVPAPAAATAPPLLPPLLTSLVTLHLDSLPCVYARRTNALKITADNVPSLRALRVSLAQGSDCPLVLGQRGQALPPLALLEVVALPGLCPPTTDYGRKWPVREPLLLSTTGPVAAAPAGGDLARDLGASLRHARLDCTWAAVDNYERRRRHAEDNYGRPLHDAEETTEGDATDEAAPLRADNAQSAMWSVPSGADGLRNFSAIPEVEPMARLVAPLAPFSRLTSLTLDSDFDFDAGPVYSYDNRTARIGASRRRWDAAARQILAPLAATLRSLSIGVGAYGMNRRYAHVPPCVSLLTALTQLRVSGHRVLSLGPGVRACVGLRSLEVEGDKRHFVHGPVYPRDLLPLTNLQHLRLLEAPPCLAPLIEGEGGALPSLRTLVLREDAVWGGLPESRLPPAAVLRAARRAVLAGRLGVYFAIDKSDRAPRGPVAADELAALAEKAARGYHGGGSESARQRQHDREHQRGLREADEFEALYVE